MDQINMEWVTQTDKLIEQVKKVGLQTINGDLLIAKETPQKVSSGGIHLAGIESSIWNYFKGFGRIIQLPSTGFASTEGVIECPKELKVGDFVLFNHAARYKPDLKTMNMLFEMEVEEDQDTSNVNDEFHDRGMLFFVAFPDVKMIKPADKVIKNASST